MNSSLNRELREQVNLLAEEAFHQHLISGYGDGEHPDEYQIVYQGKPRHFPLERAQSFLTSLLNSQGNRFSQLGTHCRLGLSLLLEGYRNRLDRRHPR